LSLRRKTLCLQGFLTLRGEWKTCEAGAELILLDDGLQNPGFAKNLSLLAVDARYGFGNGRVIPAGPLRDGVMTAGLAPCEIASVATTAIGLNRNGCCSSSPCADGNRPINIPLSKCASKRRQRWPRSLIPI